MIATRGSDGQEQFVQIRYNNMTNDVTNKKLAPV